MVSGADVAYYVLLPFAWLLHAVLLILTTIATPLVFLARAIWHVLMIPIRFLYFLETLLYYFGTAAAIGAGIGAGLYFVKGFIDSALALDQDDPDNTLMEVSWREQLEERKARRKPELDAPKRPSLKLATPSTGYTGLPQHHKLTPKSPSPMMSTAIHEEDDSSDGFI